jgi:hypothetical protein
MNHFGDGLFASLWICKVRITRSGPPRYCIALLPEAQRSLTYLLPIAIAPFTPLCRQAHGPSGKS